jgi:hypothetical protein
MRRSVLSTRKPDTVGANLEWLISVPHQASNYIREQNLVHQLRAALDQSLPTTGTSAQQSTDAAARKSRPSRQGISVKTDTKSFESFVKGIGKVNDLMDLRRLRSDLGGEIRKTKGSLGTSAVRSIELMRILADVRSCVTQ